MSPLHQRNWTAYRTNPVGFVHEIVGVKEIDPWQAKALNDYAHYKRVAIKGGRGIGKDALLAWLNIHFLCMYYPAKVINTSVNQDQLKDVLWDEISIWINHSPYLKQFLHWTKTRIEVMNPTKADRDPWYATYAVAAKKYSHATGDLQAEGLAGRHMENLLYCMDEASGVEEVHWNTIEGSLTGTNNRWVVVGNPLRTHGRFFDIFSKAAQHWKPEQPWGWRLHTASKFDANRPGIRESAEADIAAHGKNSPYVQANVYGLFPTASSSDTGYTYAEIGEAMARSIADDPEIALQIGVDCARFGDDEMVIIPRRGFKQLSLVTRPKTSGPEIVGLIVNEACRWWRTTEPRETPLDDDQLEQCKAEVILVIDETGMGGLGVVDPLNEQGWRNVIGVENGARANDSAHYVNRGAEMWLEDARQAILSAELIEDDILRQQLTTRKYTFSGKGMQRKLEDKQSMKRRGLSSPDRADALILAFANVDAGPSMYIHTEPELGFRQPVQRFRRRRRHPGLSFGG